MPFCSRLCSRRLPGAPYSSGSACPRLRRSPSSTGLTHSPVKLLGWGATADPHQGSPPIQLQDTTPIRPVSECGTGTTELRVGHVDGRRGACYGGVNYRCPQAHTTQAGWEPPAVPALWRRIRSWAGVAPPSGQLSAGTVGGTGPVQG
ncbi:carbohydrate-binding protein [Streptosporangium roseum]|uniref:carbohydrate-binding protein n=1 Tax=Streptosporangium roseum TaxID=2001 RepID=UPI0033269F54